MIYYDHFSKWTFSLHTKMHVERGHNLILSFKGNFCYTIYSHHDTSYPICLLTPKTSADHANISGAMALIVASLHIMAHARSIAIALAWSHASCARRALIAWPDIAHAHFDRFTSGKKWSAHLTSRQHSIARWINMCKSWSIHLSLHELIILKGNFRRLSISSQP